MRYLPAVSDQRVVHEEGPGLTVDAFDDDTSTMHNLVGGRQYIVFPGRYLYTQRLKDANVDDQIVLNKVLLVGTKTHTYIGKPVVTNATVHAVVENQGLDDKVVVFKYKPKKKYRRYIGHRQPNTRIRITWITGYEEYPAAPNVAV
ncbi:PREDICTED: 50S ribosomal protein L21, chloroplastic-like [Camelina sativa]|uniref:50S ribosomal protein L21, chloroplastic-like n=1 Tax=Camelina sativa TaxID=90675 RepID=A0ABM1RP64_CAMSA|nr:PREDICTED: 50S ribosomal protein L21, chloroplastic-like [Camelina sativa]